jgi:hypothetical protein
MLLKTHNRGIGLSVAPQRLGEPTKMTNTSSYPGVLRVAGVRPFRWMQFLHAFNDNEYKLVTFFAGRASNDEPGQQWYLSLVGRFHLHLGLRDSVLHFNELKSDGCPNFVTVSSNRQA